MIKLGGLAFGRRGCPSRREAAVSTLCKKCRQTPILNTTSFPSQITLRSRRLVAVLGMGEKWLKRHREVEKGQATAESRGVGGAGSEVPNQTRCGSRDARAASWESVGRSEVRAEVSGAMSHDCSNVSGTRGLHKEPASASYNPNCTF